MWSKGTCVPNFRSVSFFFWPGGQTNEKIHIQGNRGDMRKIHVRRAAGRGYSYFHLHVCVRIYLCVKPPGQTKNDTDLKFGTHTPLDHI